MAKPYPIELRTRVIQLYKSGEYTVRSLSKAVSLGVATVNRWLSRFHKSGEIMPKPGGRGFSAKIDKNGEEQLKAILTEQPDILLEDLTERYNEKSTIKVSRSAVERALQRMKITRKKRLGLPQSKQRNGYKNYVVNGKMLCQI